MEKRQGIRRLLLTGASGFLGWHISQAACREWEVFGTVRSHGKAVPGVRVIRTDLTDFQDLKSIFQRVRPHAVIHGAAVTDPNFCQVNRDGTRRVNVDAAVNMAGLCADRSIPCVFTSTDLVFDGINPPYAETDPVCPVNAYGEQKVHAEEGVARTYPQAAVCRLSLMFGFSGSMRTNFFQNTLKAMEQGEAVRLFSDEFRTMLSPRAAVAGLFTALDRVNGTIHLGGAERISRYEFARLTAQVFNLADEHLVPCRQAHVKMAAPRPRDVSLDIRKARSLGFSPLPLAEELALLNGPA
jgi:dTDP-4-dehydrorhamnose reductase